MVVVMAAIAAVAVVVVVAAAVSVMVLMVVVTATIVVMLVVMVTAVVVMMLVVMTVLVLMAMVVVVLMAVSGLLFFLFHRLSLQFFHDMVKGHGENLSDMGVVQGVVDHPPLLAAPDDPGHLQQP